MTVMEKKLTKSEVLYAKEAAKDFARSEAGTVSIEAKKSFECSKNLGRVLDSYFGRN